MTFTFDETDISTSLARVRVLIGDTDSTDQLLSDEIINYYLSVDDNVFGAAALAARAVQANFARKADTSIESVSVKYSQRAQQYGSLAEDLSSQAEVQDLVEPSVLGISIDAIQDERAEKDRVQEKFFMEKFSNPPGHSDNSEILSDD